MKSRSYHVGLLALCCLLLSACTMTDFVALFASSADTTQTPPMTASETETATTPESEVEAAMQRYNQLILAMDAEGIAAMYTEDGQLGDGPQAVRGREAIRDFLASFTDVTVLAYSTTTDSMTVSGDTAVQTGTYEQRARLASGRTVTVRGTYRAEWVRQDGQWLSQKLTTRPL